MQPNRRLLKAEARRLLLHATPNPLLAALAYLLLTAGLTTLLSMALPSPSLQQLLTGRFSSLSLFLLVLSTLYNMILDFGFAAWCLACVRGRQGGPLSLLDGFGMAGSVLMMNLQLLLRTLLWSVAVSLLCTFPVYLLLSLVHAAAPGAYYSAMELTLYLLSLLVQLLLLRYALAPYLLSDYPGDGGWAAVRRSAGTMTGRVLPLFTLYLSFLGWFLLQLALEPLLSLLLLLPQLPEIGALLSAGQLDALGTFLQTQLSAPLPTLLYLVLRLPLEVWVTAYVGLSLAGFYQSVSSSPVHQIPPL